MAGRKCILALALGGAVLCGRLSAGPSPRPAAPKPATRPAAADGKPVLHRAKRQVILPAVVQLQKGTLEFLLCVKGAKDHETLLVTKVPPSALHASLLALGVMPGRPGRWTTPPGGQPVFEPAKGARLDVTLRWKDPKGRAREMPARQWLLAAGKETRPSDVRWVFVGSDFLDDGRYWADVEGLHISVANFAASVVDVPFKSSAENAFLEFACNDKAVPAKGTPVQVVITVPKGEEKAPVARVSFTVDRFGRIELDGRAVAPEDVGQAVKKFLSQHAKGVADVRVDPRALVYDRDRLKALLDDAGLTDVTWRTRALTAEVLPRTSEQATKAIAWWKRQFARAQDLIVDPAEDAEALLKHIQRRRKQVEALSELWGDYAVQLRTLLAKHRRKAGSAEPEKP